MTKRASSDGPDAFGGQPAIAAATRRLRMMAAILLAPLFAGLVQPVGAQPASRGPARVLAVARIPGTAQAPAAAQVIAAEQVPAAEGVSVPAHGSADAQAPARGHHGAGADIVAYVTSPARWNGRDWIKFGSAVATVAAAYQFDDRVRAHFGTTTTPPGTTHDNYDLHDALPAAVAFAGTWIYARLIGSDDGRREAAAMLEAAGFGSATAFVLKQATGRERPFETSEPGSWHSGGDSFPSIHATAAFAIGTVLAESGNDDFRWVRRVLGYGIAAGTAYERLDHGDHWLSDTVAGAAIGIASAHFAMHRRYAGPAASFSLTPLARGGMRLSYNVALH